jgi:hypothetical protein
MLTVAHSYASGKREHRLTDRHTSWSIGVPQPDQEGSNMDAGLGVGIFYLIILVFVLIYLAESH